MTGLSRVTVMTKMTRVFSILPAFEKSVCSELGEFCLIAKCRLPFTLKMSKKSLESIKAVHGKESPKGLSMNCLILGLNCVIIACETNEELTWCQ